jgi:hypothetical protein
MEWLPDNGENGFGNDPLRDGREIARLQLREPLRGRDAGDVMRS